MASLSLSYSLFNVRDGKPNWLPIAAESEKQALAAFAQQAIRGPVMLFVAIFCSRSPAANTFRSTKFQPKNHSTTIVGGLDLIKEGRHSMFLRCL